MMQNAPTFEDAHHVASTVSTSALVKTALYGQDAKCVNSSLSLLIVEFNPVFSVM